MKPNNNLATIELTKRCRVFSHKGATVEERVIGDFKQDASLRDDLRILMTNGIDSIVRFSRILMNGRQTGDGIRMRSRGADTLLGASPQFAKPPVERNINVN